MTEQDLLRSLWRLCWLAGLYVFGGCVYSFYAAQFQGLLGFAFGALASFVNLWLFIWLTRAISPSGSSRRRWPTSLYISRLLILFFTGYGIVKLLGVSPLSIVLGLLASTFAVLVSIIIELIQSFSQVRHIRWK
jgi:hypothetical protein